MYTNVGVGKDEPTSIFLVKNEIFRSNQSDS